MTVHANDFLGVVVIVACIDGLIVAVEFIPVTIVEIVLVCDRDFVPTAHNGFLKS